ncbi:MAG TPA: DNA polymerase III subunit alpha [Burkholderiaceae bacterium]|nr:DNA polymerase III subunit alpha [Burkholderiaceae bacterium]
MSDPRFVHLRVHSEYSISDSIVRIEPLLDAAAADGQPAIALTDSANLFGWIKFYGAARARGIKGICGADCWLTNDADRDRPFRLLLLARDYDGYLALCRLLSRAWLENEHRGRGELRAQWFDDQPVPGLIALSGAQAGDVGQALLAGNDAAAQRLAEQWSRRLPGAYYLEVQRSGQPEAEAQLRAAARLAARTGLPLAATHPVQFLRRDEYRAHEARVCIADGEILANPRRVRRFTEQQYFKTQAEMAELFADLPSAVANTVQIARRCNVSIELGKSRLPEFPTPDAMSVEQYLRVLAQQGLAHRLRSLYPQPEALAAREAQYAARLQLECDTIIAMGFAGYFLIVADFINWAKANGVPVGPGRGSGAGSLVAFALGITDLDPIPYALLFERFLNPERVSMPDFDIDFCQDNRWKVIEYVRRKYGADAVAQIATFGTMASKAVIRDVGRVLDMPYYFCDQLSKLVPVVQNKPLSLAKAREAEPQLKERESREDEVRELLALAESLEDITRNVGMHAGGVLIAPGRLTDFCPLYRAPGTDSVISQYDKDDVEAVGLVKFDFLGLRNLTIIQLAVDYVNRRRPEHDKLDLAKLSFDDPKAYKILKDANTTAIFQVEGEGMKKLLKKLAPDRFEDIIAVLALYRPGPLGSGMVDDFILRKKGQQRIDYFHPDLKQCLEPTYGVIVYQEQVMQIAQIVAGYSLGGADLLRRAMGKKKPEEMEKQRAVFIDGARNKGYDPDLATQLFDLMEKFAEYGFNKSHTAAYAVVTYQTAWLKAHFPAEFMAATLSSDMDDTDKVQLFAKDARDNGVTLLGPCVNASQFRFEPVDERTIRYGLGAVKGTGETAVADILAKRAERPFTDLFDFCARVDKRIVNRRCIEALIRAGAFDALDADRAKLLANVGRAIDAAEQHEASAGQVSLFGPADAGPLAPEWIAAPPWDERRRLQEEKLALGYYLSGHLYHGFAGELRRFVKLRLADLARLAESSNGPTSIAVAGVVASLQPMMTRRGRMLRLVLDDASAAVEITVFNELYDQHRALLKEDELLIVHGKLARDDYTGGFRVTAERLMDLATARQEFARSLTLRMNGKADGGRLQALLGPWRASPERGDARGCPVEIVYDNGTALCAVRLGDDWRVKPDDVLLAQLREWLSPDDVELRYG